jgi:hypothetical protein
MSALGPLAELQAGEAGPRFAAELLRTIRAVAVARNFPPPDGHTAWDADAVRTVASEFLTDPQTPRRLADLAVHCASDAALRARLQGAVRNFLADLGRRTPIGKLVVRINDVLRSEPGFVRVGGRWARETGRRDPGSDDPDALSRAIASHEVVVPAWGNAAQRSAPVADRRTIVSLCAALLDAAGGALTPRALARAIGTRVGLGQAPLSLDVAALDGAAAQGPALGGDSTAAEALRMRRAGEVLAELNDRERAAIAYPELAVRQLAPLLGVSASQSHVIRGRAVETIRAELVDDDDAERVALLVMELARRWTETVDIEARSAVLVAR